jgi:hypothetical protein
MKRRKLHRADSLDLLLSTMTSSFGGIILIAILVALVSHGSKAESDRARIADADSEMLQRRIAKAKTDLVAAANLKQVLGNDLDRAGAGDVLTLLQQRDQLRVQVEQATEKTSKLGAVVQNTQIEMTKDPGDTLRMLNTEYQDLLRGKTDETNRQASISENIERLKTRLSDLASENAKDRDQKIRKLRLPKERDRGKTAFNFIVRYQRVYPLKTIVNGEPELNKESLTWDLSEDSESAKVHPIEGEGLDVVKDKDKLVQLLQNIPKDEYYGASYVYGDSFSTFNAFKQLILDAGLDYGWEPEGALDTLVFGKKGTSPPPL